MRGLVHKFYCEIYKTNLTVCFDRDTCGRRYGDIEAMSCVDGGVWLSDDAINIFLEKKNGVLQVPTCAHEAYHAAELVCGRVGLVTDNGHDNEHMAYLIEWIVHKIFDCLEHDNNTEKKLTATTTN